LFVLGKNANNHYDIVYTHGCIAYTSWGKSYLKEKENWNVALSCSLSRREESCKHKLSDCLLACLSAGSKEHCGNLRDSSTKTWTKVIKGGESEPEVSFN